MAKPQIIQTYHNAIRYTYYCQKLQILLLLITMILYAHKPILQCVQDKDGIALHGISMLFKLGKSCAS